MDELKQGAFEALKQTGSGGSVGVECTESFLKDIGDRTDLSPPPKRLIKHVYTRNDVTTDPLCPYSLDEKNFGQLYDQNTDGESAGDDTEIGVLNVDEENGQTILHTRDDAPEETVAIWALSRSWLLSTLERLKLGSYRAIARASRPGVLRLVIVTT